MPCHDPHGRNLRKGRFSQRGRIYLLTFCCHQRRPVFLDRRLPPVVIEEMRRSDAGGASRTLAFVVMPDHVHWVLEYRQRASIGAVVRLVKGCSATRINRLLGVRGRLWQSGYHDRAIRAEEDLESVCQYVIQNPLRAGLVRRVEDYPFHGFGFGCVAPGERCAERP
jgi:putative transposase